MSDEFVDWISAFFDAEGSVGMQLNNDGRGETGYSVGVIMRMTQAYTAGMVDGEGNVSASVGKSERMSVGYGIFPEVRVRQSDREAMEMIQKYCHEEVGVDCVLREEKRSDDDTRHGRLILKLTGRDDVWKFLSHIRRHVIVKRPQVEIMLTEILPALDEGKHLTKEGFIEVMEMRDRMDSYKGGNRGKYNADYFRELWGYE